MKLKYLLIVIAAIALGASLFMAYFPLAIPGRTRQIPSPNGKRIIVVDIDHDRNSNTYHCVRIRVISTLGKTEFLHQTSDPYRLNYSVVWSDDNTICYDGPKSSFIQWKYYGGRWRQTI